METTVCLGDDADQLRGRHDQLLRVVGVLFEHSHCQYYILWSDSGHIVGRVCTDWINTLGIAARLSTHPHLCPAIIRLS